MAELTDIREAVRRRYADAALATAADAGTDGCCGQQAGCGCAPGAQAGAFGSSLYGTDSGAPEPAIKASLGCGVPTAVADLREGEVVLDLGSGAGADVLISARRVGPEGRAIGIDMTDEMLDLARANAKLAGASNVEFLKGYLEAIPLADASVDVVISNCVINLAADKALVIGEAARVLKPGGRLAISDVIADQGVDARVRADIGAWTGCVAGALTRREFETVLRTAGFDAVEIQETHRVHEHAGSAVVRATRSAA